MCFFGPCVAAIFLSLTCIRTHRYVTHSTALENAKGVEREQLEAQVEALEERVISQRYELANMFAKIMSQALNVDGEMHALGLVEKFKTMEGPSKLDGKIAELKQKLAESKRTQQRALQTVLANVSKRYLSLAEVAAEVNEGRTIFNHGDKNSFERKCTSLMHAVEAALSSAMAAGGSKVMNAGMYLDPPFIFNDDAEEREVGAAIAAGDEAISEIIFGGRHSLLLGGNGGLQGGDNNNMQVNDGDGTDGDGGIKPSKINKEGALDGDTMVLGVRGEELVDALEEALQAKEIASKEADTSKRQLAVLKRTMGQMKETIRAAAKFEHENEDLKHRVAVLEAELHGKQRA